MEPESTLVYISTTEGQIISIFYLPKNKKKFVVSFPINNKQQTFLFLKDPYGWYMHNCSASNIVCAEDSDIFITL